MRISRPTRSCTLRLKVYVTYRAGAAFDDDLRVAQSSPTPPPPAEALTQSKAPRQLSLRLDVYPSSQVLQTTGCLYHLTPASRVDEGTVCSRAPWLHGRYPASSLLRAQPTPSRLRLISRGLRLYSRLCSADFSTGRGRSLQLLGLSLSPCCPYHPAGVTCRISQIAAGHVAFARRERARPPDSSFCRGHLWVHSRCGPVTRSPSRRRLCQSASSASFPPLTRLKLRGL